jgi:DNA replication protein DnaC
VELEVAAAQKQVKHLFNFDCVFDKKSTQENVYEEVQHLVKSFLDGHNVCVFSYGQTGSGKTYTMGTDSAKLSDQHLGIIPRAV